MKVSLTAAAALFTSSALAGSALMRTMMKEKIKFREESRRLGRFHKAHSHQRPVRCRDGKSGEYACNNVDMKAFISHADMGSPMAEGNDLWGWTSPDGREFAIVGQTDGTAFVEILWSGRLQYIGRLPTQTTVDIWRDIKAMHNHAYIVADVPHHGMQVFDLTKLLEVKPRWWSRFTPKTFDIETDLTTWYQGFGASHNLVTNEETNMIYAVGSWDGEEPNWAAGETDYDWNCAGGMHMLDVSNPADPTFVDCFDQDNYTHDAQCVVYTGVDTSFTGHEICFNYNERNLLIVDLTDKANPIIISNTTYVGASYTHQGWVVDTDFTTLLLDDELDELRARGPAANRHSTTYIVDIRDLANPVFTGTYQSPTIAIDHNLYVHNGLAYLANYNSGLRIVDVGTAGANASYLERLLRRLVTLIVSLRMMRLLRQNSLALGVRTPTLRVIPLS